MTNAVIAGIGAIIGMVIMLAIVAIVKLAKEKAAVKPLPQVEVSAKERQGIMENAGTAVPFQISEDVFGEMTDLNVDWIDVYGVRYYSFSSALESKDLIKEEADAMRETDAMVAVVRNESMHEKRYLQVKDMLDGKVYIYEPCKMKLDVDNLAPRVAVELVRNKDLSMMIQTILVSKLDVTIASHRYEFDMLNLDDVEAFKLLVREDAAYEKEMKQLAEIEARIAHYNQLVARDRVAMENGHIIIYPPSPAEIKAQREEKKPVKKVTRETLDIKKEIEEFVSSSTL